ncbi:ABC transporter ATP-binding protein [Paenibacillus sp. HB172176]|uniref:ABC transporter ATP-binding protein n=1 Tax=Paenibacillus sp. HB172176 TaxID=2493690 RepID=UPI00197CD017|nr:ABC transporter ATP-binding protein [Paenibacillus sp. HB172176]
MNAGVAALEQPPVSLAVDRLVFGFPGEPPMFDQLGFELRQGEFVSLLAASGLGKTTLFRLLSGLLPAKSGSIRIGADGMDVASAARHGRIGYMPQRDGLMPWRTVLDNAAIGLELRGAKRKDARSRVLELLPDMGLAGTERKYPHELSGGMRQRVSFLRSLLGGGELLLLDEPFGALDAMTRASMQEWLLQSWEQHRKTVLFITHDVDEALLLSDRVLVAAQSPIAAFEAFDVPLSRPRRQALVMEPSFVALKKQLLRLYDHSAQAHLAEHDEPAPGSAPHKEATLR